MIKAVFFDFDGVLTNFECGSYTVCYNLHQKTGIPLDALLSAYDKYGSALNHGKITHKEMWEGFCKDLGRTMDMKLLDYAFRTTPINNDLFGLTGELRKNYKIGIITDNSKERFGAIINEFGLRDAFDALILSAEIGSTKKNEKIFAHALEAFDLKPEECVFIDNSKKNLDIPARMGFKTILWDSAKNDISSLVLNLKSLGVMF